MCTIPWTGTGVRFPRPSPPHRTARPQSDRSDRAPVPAAIISPYFKRPGSTRSEKPVELHRTRRRLPCQPDEGSPNQRQVHPEERLARVSAVSHTRGPRNVIAVACDHAPMPECQNCGTFVTAAYRRVFAPAGADQVRVCPYCPDKIRDHGEVRPARSPRKQ